MALIIAITYSLTDENKVDLNIDSVTTEKRIIDTNGQNTINIPERILNASEIFTMLLDTNWPLTGKVLTYVL